MTRPLPALLLLMLALATGAAAQDAVPPAPAALSSDVPARAVQSDEAIHAELRGLLAGLEKAINEERYGDLAPFFHENLRVTTINQEVIRERQAIAPYFQRWFGPGGYLRKLNIRLTADALTELDDSRRYGVVTGAGEEKYILADGRDFDMHTRWTATVMRGGDGRWRILTLHIGTNFLDNPILDQAESSLMTFALGGGAIGLGLGALGMGLWRRRKPA